jgi:hypothetical protein
MIKKISYLILSVAIVAVGLIAFSKLSYFDRSFRIIGYNSNTTFEGRMNRGREERGEYGERGRTDRQERTEGEFGRPEMRELPDSLRQRFRQGNGERMERGRIEGGIRNGEGHGRGEFTGGKKIDLRNVQWFLAVFALFTVAAVYFDKFIKYFRNRKGRQDVIEEIQ